MNIQKQIQAVPWVKMKEREYDLHYGSIYAKGYEAPYFKKMGVDFGMQDYIQSSDGKIFFGENDMWLGRKIFAGTDAEIASLAKKATESFMRMAGAYEAFLKKVSKVKFGSLAEKQAAKIFGEYVEHNYKLVPYSFVISMMLEETAQNLIIKSLTGKVADPASEYQKLIVSKKVNDTVLEYQSRLELAGLLKSHNKNFGKAFDKHLEKYAWIACYGPMNIPLTKEKLLDSVKKLAMEEGEVTRDKEKAAAKTSYALDKDTKALVKVMTDNVWIRTYRRELMARGYYLTLPLYRRIGELLKFPYEDLHYLTTWEIEELLSNKVIGASLEKRRLNSATMLIGGVPTIFEGDVAEENPTLKGQASGATSLTGTSVFKGIATGKVRIIKRREEMAVFQKGEILVAPTVATWMTHIVEICSGIVTDAGGVLSHTAIVAREFKKPCIIGTKVATDTFENGDMVEVDADKGVAKLIK